MPPGLHLDPDRLLTAAALAEDLALQLRSSRSAFDEHRGTLTRVWTGEVPDLEVPLRRASEELSAAADLLRHTAAAVLRADADAARTFSCR